MTTAATATVEFVQHTFVIVLSLGLTEAFKQFVKDSVKDEGEINQPKTIHWDRLPSLLIFMMLIVPFFQGMNRQFHVAYTHPGGVQQHGYELSLILDGFGFLLESVVFFIMSRNLAARNWRNLFNAILSLMLVDSLWCVYGWWREGFDPCGRWIILNGILAMLLLFGFALARRGVCDLKIALWGVVANAVIFAANYSWEWRFFFPAAP